VPLGIARAGAGAELIAKLKLFAATGIVASLQFLQKKRATLAAAVRLIRNIGTNALHKVRQGVSPALRRWLRAVAGQSRSKLGAGLAVTALGLALVIVFASGRHGRLEAPNAGTPSQPPGPSVAFAEERPLRDAKDEFTRTNLRYCTFQQVRLESLGPIT